MVAAAFLFTGFSATSQAAPISPMSSAATSADSGQITKVYWHGHRHCWRGPYGHMHCGW
jgi:hypothetical protein